MEREGIKKVLGRVNMVDKFIVPLLETGHVSPLTFDIVYLQGIDFVLNSFGSYVM